MPLGLVDPDWSAPANVRVACTTRHGGVSIGAYAQLNLGYHVGDATGQVARNRRRLFNVIGHDRVQWLDQVHGVTVHRAAEVRSPVRADAAWCEAPGIAIAIMTADCVPMLISDDAGTVVAAVHCGWRGAVDGIIEATLRVLPVAASKLNAWLGPGICGRCYEVGGDVYDRVGSDDVFAATSVPGKWLFDLPAYLVRQLTDLGVPSIGRSGACTHHESRFFSYRRDGTTGRMATVIWLAETRNP